VRGSLVIVSELAQLLAAEQAVEDSTKNLGWKSNAFQMYIRRDRVNLANLAGKLAGGIPT